MDLQELPLAGVTSVDHPCCHMLLCCGFSRAGCALTLDRSQCVHTSLLHTAGCVRCIPWHVTKKRWLPSEYKTKWGTAGSASSPREKHNLMRRRGLGVFSLQLIYQPRDWRNTLISKHIHDSQTVRIKPDKGQPLAAFKTFLHWFLLEIQSSEWDEISSYSSLIFHNYASLVFHNDQFNHFCRLEGYNSQSW